MNTYRKAASIALSVATAVSFSGVFHVLPVAQAQTAEQLQTQIAQLLAQIQQLQSQLGNAKGDSSAAYNFTRNLTTGSKGEDVRALQQLLNSKGFKVAASGTGSPGKESTYFGPATRAALAKFQAANGISPAVGYFGSITRSAIASVGGGRVGGGTTGGGTTGGGTTGGGPVIPGSGLTVTLAPNNPPAGSIISSSGSAAARVPVLTVSVTAGAAGGVTLNDLSFKKVGVLSDNSISSAYIVENGRVLTQFSSISNGIINFTGAGIGINAGQTRTLTLSIDPSTGLSAGNTVSFSLDSASGIKAVDNTNNMAAVNGFFPMQGNVFTVTSVSNPSIASLTVASSSVGTSVYAGTTGVLLSQWTLTGANSAVNLSSINFKVVGSANKTDLRNLKLFVNGKQVGPTLAAVDAGGTAFFDLTSSPARINTGSSNLQVFGDVLGSPSFNFQFELLNGYDVLAVDTQYNTPVTVTVNGGAGIQVSILQGALTVTLASDTPTGNVAKGGAGTALAKFAIFAAGEPLKMKFVSFQLVPAGSLGATWDKEIKNVVLNDDAGNQVGTAINSLTTTVTCTDGTFSAATSTATNCFGNSSSPINYTIPANTARILTLRGDIQTTAAFTTIQAKLVASTNNNLQGLISSQTANSGSVNGATLTLSANAITVAQNTAVGSPTYSASSLNQRIGSYTLSASSAEGVRLNSITITTSASSTNFQNLRVMVDGQQFGITQTTLSASAAYTFSGNLFVPVGQTKTVDVVADILSGTAANTYTAVTTLSNCSGNGDTTFASVSCSSTAGQNVVVAGQATVQVGIDSGTPPADQIVMGSTDVVLARFRFTETSNIEDIRINGQNALSIIQTVAATNTVKSAFGGLRLYAADGSLLATAGSAITLTSTTTPGPGYYYQFSFIGNGLVVPKSNSIVAILKGSVSAFSASGASDNTTHVFKIATSTTADAAIDTTPEVIIALGNTSNASSAVTFLTGAGTPASNAQTVLRTKLTVSAATLGSTAGRAKNSVDDFATISFTADAAGAAALNTLVVTFSGTAPSIGTFLDGVTLLDQNGVNVTGVSGVTVATSSACNGSNTCTKTWKLGSSNLGWQIGSSGYTFKLRIDGTKTQAGSANLSQTLTATVNANTDVAYTDALSSDGTSNVNLPSKVVPIPVQSVSFASGT